MHSPRLILHAVWASAPQSEDATLLSSHLLAGHPDDLQCATAAAMTDAAHWFSFRHASNCTITRSE